MGYPRQNNGVAAISSPGGPAGSGVKPTYPVAALRSLCRVRLFVTPWTAARQASVSFTVSQSLLKLMSIQSVMPSNQLSHPLSPLLTYPQSFPASGSFPVNQPFTSGGQSIGVSASASVLSMNIQGWFLACPPEQKPSFTHSQCLPSGSLHELLSLIHQRVDRIKTTVTES